MAKANDDSEFRFMNYGFEDGNGPELESEDEANRMFIQLYSMNIRGVDLEGKQALEVGSGRGGGASWIAKTHTPTKLTGVDFSAEAVGHCNRWYADQSNLEFIEGNAQDLPFENESFDVVYNVESSHCYGDMGAFVEQAYRVLKPGGMFCWTDLRDAKTMATLPSLFESKGFEIVESADVAKEVIQALDEINEMKMKAIEFVEFYRLCSGHKFLTTLGYQQEPLEIKYLFLEKRQVGKPPILIRRSIKCWTTRQTRLRVARSTPSSRW